MSGKYSPFRPTPPSTNFSLHSPITRKRYLTSPHTSTQLPLLSHFHSLKPDSDQNTIRFKTEGSSVNQEQSNHNYCQLSRFIYNHLQKKINFQQKLYRDLDSPYPTPHSTPDPLNSIDPTQHSLHLHHRHSKPHVYAYQKKTHSIDTHRLTQTTKPLNKLKHKLMLRNQPQRVHTQHLTAPRHNLKRNTHIDAYFDLSCLQKMQHHKQQLFSLTNPTH